MNEKEYRKATDAVIREQNKCLECGEWRFTEGDWGCRKHAGERAQLEANRGKALEQKMRDTIRQLQKML